MLQREFRERDVQRMRNIIKKEYTAKTTTQVGYTKSFVEYKEGDVWEENGKQWTIKNGIKQTITRFDKLKQQIIDDYNKSQIQPGQMVGVDSATSLGEPTTQMTLNSFHSAGKTCAAVTTVCAITLLVSVVEVVVVSAAKPDTNTPAIDKA